VLCFGIPFLISYNLRARGFRRTQNVQDKVRYRPVALDLARYELRRSGQRIGMERIPMDLLILLARSGGRLLTRNEIIDHLWGKNPWLDADRNLNTAIGKIRRALGDDPEKPCFIETAVGKGYRFIATVRIGMEPDPSAWNGKAEVVILDSSPTHALHEANGKPAITLPEIAAEDRAGQTSEKRQTPVRSFAFCIWIAAAAAIVLSLSVYGWKALDARGWIIRHGDTPVWIEGDWLVGEYRHCQMITTEHASIDRGGESPRLFCGCDVNGFFALDASTASVAPVRATPDGDSPSASGPYFSGVTARESGHNFHVMQVG